MFSKKLDFLPPEITLYHKGLLYHTSIISIIISILAIYEIILLTIINITRLLNRKKEIPKMSSFICFIEDAGEIPIDSSSLFHFLSISKNPNNSDDQEFDFRSFRAIRLDIYLEDYLDNQNLSNFDHWLYGPCNNDSDTKGISSLILIQLINL